VIQNQTHSALADLRGKLVRHFAHDGSTFSGVGASGKPGAVQTEDKIRIVLSGLRGEYSIAELCRREGIAQSLYYSWSKEFLEAGKKRLAGDTERQASSGEVKDLRREAGDLKELVAELTLENRLLKKSMIGDGGDRE
jgi:transposase